MSFIQRGAIFGACGLFAAGGTTASLFAWNSKNSKTTPSSSSSSTSNLAFCQPNDLSTNPRPQHYTRYEDMHPVVYKLMELDEDWVQNGGHLARGEEPITVTENAYCQMGILTPEGVRSMLQQVAEAKSNSRGGGGGGAQQQPALTPADCFVDVGCGYGNITLQVFAETHVGSVRGVDIIPSRIQWADFAVGLARIFFSRVFEDERRTIEYVTGDFVDHAVAKKTFSDATFVFSHSWMFPPELMSKFGERLEEHGSRVSCVVTNRQIPQFEEKPEVWWRGELTAEADWNTASPFFIYLRSLETSN